MTGKKINQRKRKHIVYSVDETKKKIVGRMIISSNEEKKQNHVQKCHINLKKDNILSLNLSS